MRFEHCHEGDCELRATIPAAPSGVDASRWSRTLVGVCACTCAGCRTFPGLRPARAPPRTKRMRRQKLPCAVCRKTVIHVDGKPYLLHTLGAQHQAAAARADRGVTATQ